MFFLSLLLLGVPALVFHFSEIRKNAERGGGIHCPVRCGRGGGEGDGQRRVVDFPAPCSSIIFLDGFRRRPPATTSPPSAAMASNSGRLLVGGVGMGGLSSKGGVEGTGAR